MPIVIASDNGRHAFLRRPAPNNGNMQKDYRTPRSGSISVLRPRTAPCCRDIDRSRDWTCCYSYMFAIKQTCLPIAT